MTTDLEQLSVHQVLSALLHRNGNNGPPCSRVLPHAVQQVTAEHQAQALGGGDDSGGPGLACEEAHLADEAALTHAVDPVAMHVDCGGAGVSSARLVSAVHVRCCVGVQSVLGISSGRVGMDWL